MSATHRAPSGPVRIETGVNIGSSEARNSLADSSAARRLVNVVPAGFSSSRWTRLCTGSQANQLPANSGPKSVSR